MTDRPILFSAPMVRALLDGRKTQTRRVARDTTLPHLRHAGDLHLIVGEGLLTRNHYFRVPYAVGDRLYVREAWATESAYDDLSPSAMGGEEPVRYDADGSHQTWGYPAISKIGRFRQAMHMPRWASRLTLTVTDVRVQRLQEISEEDAKAEGVDFNVNGGPDNRAAYCRLWNTLNAARGFGWDANPWVVAVSFTVARANIDAGSPCRS
ncbi:hypothetical protein EN851_07560 [Mesorhizobium sp. M8A.F.Ca.ET.208.01.1.1]|uniref:hypothetical protein n=1 Tax=unclassified Mesorhizobium TaxID=325217 RepID=UPI0010935775|nr:MULTISPECIES: hypothetical protein [unclassified Mesorhizobium]TGQ95371.1 hypothetical protein EN851_07560 [Mesorhizobium sp. M8A.F.Ca.ET.208.01.1.1]TGT55862.1 hypothetical protein EN810_07560 [Mesorhizobium sp. M8A.F.Ca.ET.167.01.1.1]